jgi:hypothetical protein
MLILIDSLAALGMTVGISLRIASVEMTEMFVEDWMWVEEWAN